MKTLTEFAGATLKNTLKTKQDLLASGKTAEELPQALSEALKLEGDKLNFTLNAAELVEKRLDDLKRVVVFSIAEGEKAPQGGIQKGEHYFVAEYYPPLNPPKGAKGKDHDRGGRRGDKRGGGRKKDGKGRGPRREKKE